MSRRVHRIGFTLIELIVVMGIIALMVGIAAPSLSRMGMFSRDPINAGARQILTMLKAARIYAGANRVDTAVVYAIGERVDSKSGEVVKVIDAIGMVRRLRPEEKDLYVRELDTLGLPAVDYQRCLAALNHSEGPDSGAFVQAFQDKPLFETLARGAVVPPDTVTNLDAGFSAIRVIDRNLNVLEPRRVPDSSDPRRYEWNADANNATLDFPGASDYGANYLDNYSRGRYPAHVFKPTGVVQNTSSTGKARFEVLVTRTPDAAEKARFEENGKPIAAAKVELYATMGRVLIAPDEW